MNRKLITRLDVILIFFVVVLSVVIAATFMLSDFGDKVVISIDGQFVCEYPIDEDLTKEIKSKYGNNTVVISNGECFVLDADCRDGICINRGKISKTGESIVCLPHKMIVEIK